MIPRDRRNFCPVCGKECFDRRSQAERVVYNSKKRKHAKESGSVYLCEHCGKYHVTHYSYENNKQRKTLYRRKQELKLFEK